MGDEYPSLDGTIKVMRASTDRVVIKPGIFAYGLSLLWIVIGVYLLWITFQLLLSPSNKAQVTPTDVVLSGLILLGMAAVGSLFLFLALQLLSQTYTVSLEGVDVRRLRGSRFIRWEEVKALGEVPILWLNSNYYLTPYEGRGIALYTSFMAHPRQSAKALIEAAYLNGADIKFKFVLGNEFGPPPYGIFTDKKVDS